MRGNDSFPMKSALRQLFLRPGFSALAILVLALGIGANAAIFGLLDAILFRPLPNDRPSEIVGLYDGDKVKKSSYRGISFPNYESVKERVTTLSGVAAYNLAMVGLTEGESTRRVFGGLVTANFFQVMGAPVSLGRGFRVEDDDPSKTTPVVVVSYSYWKRIGGDVSALGREITLNGKVFTIIGVAREGFTGTSVLFGPEFWLPMGQFNALATDLLSNAGLDLRDRNNHRLLALGRLAPGRSLAEANTELAVISAQLESAFPGENKERLFSAAPTSRISISTSPMQDPLGPVSGVLFAMSGIVLLVACLNVANMLLARGEARRKEFAIRSALGAQRGAVVKQLLLEGLVLALVGGAGGLGLAIVANKILIYELSGAVPFTISLQTSPRPVIFFATFAFCVLATLLAGLGPAWKASRADVANDLKDNAGDDRGSLLRGIRSLLAARNLLVILQVALSLALLTVAGLFTRGAIKAAQADPGFKVASGAIIEVDPNLVGYDEARGRDVYARLLTRLAAAPGVRAVGLAGSAPFGEFTLMRGVRATGNDGKAPAEAIDAHYRMASTDYFASVGLTLLRGRTFTSAEMVSGEAAAVVIIDEALAKKLWPGEDPIGRTLQIKRNDERKDEGSPQPDGRPKVDRAIDRPLTVVGIAPPVRDSLFEHSAPGTCYIPLGADYQSQNIVHVLLATPSGSEAEAAMLQTLRREVRAVDERLPVLKLKTLQRYFSESILLWFVRVGAVLFGVFGGAALFLAVIGLYGVKSYVVTRRSREIGIRMALGAGRAGILRMILREGLLLTGAGIALGLPIALGAGIVVSAALYDVKAYDPLVLVIIPLVLTGVAAIACYLPARRATLVNPVEALRAQ